MDLEKFNSGGYAGVNVNSHPTPGRSKDYVGSEGHWWEIGTQKGGVLEDFHVLPGPRVWDLVGD